MRLKGGDPFVFGRGGEEAEALAEAGVRFEVVPGVTAGVAAPAYAGIPVTHRDEASAVAFVTAHEDPDKAESALDWAALAAFPGTLVFYMGVQRAGRGRRRPDRAGRAAAEPAAVVERGTTARPAHRVGAARADRRAGRGGRRRAARRDDRRPGRGAARAAWHGSSALRCTAAGSRSRGRAPRRADSPRSLEALGAEVIEAPAIRIEPRSTRPRSRPRSRRSRTGRYDVVCLTSPNGAELLMDALDRCRGSTPARWPASRSRRSGPARPPPSRRGGCAPTSSRSARSPESLAEELLAAGVHGKRVLVARAAEARDVLPHGAARGGRRRWTSSRSTRPCASRSPRSGGARSQEADYVTFTSSSTVRFFCEALGGAERLPDAARVVSIGPVTSATARELGLEVDVEAERHDVDGLVEALLADARSAAAAG